MGTEYGSAYRKKKYKGGAISVPQRRKGNHKNTKRWCKGVVGREHDKVWTLSPKHSYTSNWYILVCKVCSKEFDYCWFSKWPRFRQKCKCGHHPGA